MTDTARGQDAMAGVLMVIQQAMESATAGRLTSGQIALESCLFAMDDSASSTADCLDLDSLEALDVVLMVEDEYGLEILDDARGADLRTVADLCTFVLQRLQCIRSSALDSSDGEEPTSVPSK